jgi:transglutaminase-like putative cysteine protease
VIYDVRQSTTYSYASPVAYAHHLLRLTPIDREGQRVHATALDIVPAPAERREGKDFFGNRTTWVSIDHPHDRLVVKVAARIAVETGRVPAPDEATDDTPPWRDVCAAAATSSDFGPLAPVHFLFPSRQVPLDAGIRDYTADSFPPERTVLAGAIDLMHRVYDDFTYEPGATTAYTTPPAAFALRRGVCQDFAHIMIAGLRGLGLPAAYVSGYLRTEPPPGRERLEGADAMHAWMMVWCGEEAGWIGLDPTNDILAGDDHVVLAIGRDYADVAPVDGVIYASGGQRIAVAVSVVPLK